MIIIIAGFLTVESLKLKVEARKREHIWLFLLWCLWLVVLLLGWKVLTNLWITHGKKHSDWFPKLSLTVIQLRNIRTTNYWVVEKLTMERCIFILKLQYPLHILSYLCVRSLLRLVSSVGWKIFVVNLPGSFRSSSQYWLGYEDMWYKTGKLTNCGLYISRNQRLLFLISYNLWSLWPCMLRNL